MLIVNTSAYTLIALLPKDTDKRYYDLVLEMTTIFCTLAKSHMVLYFTPPEDTDHYKGKQ
jgi:hypothetical protein